MEHHAHTKVILSRQDKRPLSSVQVSENLAIAVLAFAWTVPNDELQLINLQFIADALKHGLIGTLWQLIVIALDQDDIPVQPLSALNKVRDNIVVAKITGIKDGVSRLHDGIPLFDKSLLLFLRECFPRANPRLERPEVMIARYKGV